MQIYRRFKKLIAGAAVTSLAVICASTAVAQAAPAAAPPPAQQHWPEEHWCPGLFPSDLTLQNCNYSQRKRVEDWVTTTFTDQAALTSLGSALWGFAIRSPNQWPRTLLGVGERWRASYMGGLGNGTTQFVIGSVLHLDPRHVSCAEDPLNQHAIKSAAASRAPSPCSGFGKRTWHAVEDTVLVRQSNPYGDGRRWPSPRILGGVAGAYAASPWQPAGENTPQAVFTRAGQSLVLPLLGSLMHEYPGLLKGLTKVFHRSKPLPEYHPGVNR